MPKARHFRLSSDAVGLIESLRDALDVEVAQLTDDWYARSEKWRESPEGNAADAWLEELEDLRATLEGLDREAPES